MGKKNGDREDNLKEGGQVNTVKAGRTKFPLVMVLRSIGYADVRHTSRRYSDERE